MKKLMTEERLQGHLTQNRHKLNKEKFTAFCNKVKELTIAERERRATKGVITHDIGTCGCCGGTTCSGMIHICDECYDRFEFLIGYFNRGEER